MKIVGVVLVKNEDVFVKQAIQNILGFVDECIVIDNNSIDNTIEEVKAATVSNSKPFQIHHQPDLTKTHEYIVPYVNTDTWIFGVDGDEIYDPVGLDQLRPMLEKGKFSHTHLVCGMFCHITSHHALKEGGSQVTGYLSPPSKGPTKLYYMKNILKWSSDGIRHLFLCRPCALRTNGEVDVSLFMRKEKIRPTVTMKNITGTYLNFQATEEQWNTCPLRCVHTRFYTRSSQESEKTCGKRANCNDVRHGKQVNLRKGYKQGKVMSVYAPFFRQRTHEDT